MGISKPRGTALHAVCIIKIIFLQKQCASEDADSKCFARSERSESNTKYLALALCKTHHSGSIVFFLVLELYGVKTQTTVHQSSNTSLPAKSGWLANTMKCFRLSSELQPDSYSGRYLPEYLPSGYRQSVF